MPAASAYVKRQIAPILTVDGKYDQVAATLVESMMAGLDRLADVAEDVPFEGFGQLLDVDECPSWGLDWLGQWVGATNLAHLTDAQKREAIRAQQGMSRGRNSAVISSVQRTLTGAKHVYLAERYLGNAYAVLVVTRVSETPDVQATMNAAKAALPAGRVLVFSVVPVLTYAELEAGNPTYADLIANYATYADIEGGTLTPTTGGGGGGGGGGGPVNNLDPFYPNSVPLTHQLVAPQVATENAAFLSHINDVLTYVDPGTGESPWPNLSLRAYTHPAYFVDDPATPWIDLTGKIAYNTNLPPDKRVPFLSGAEPDPGTDRHMSLIDRRVTPHKIYDLFNVNRIFANGQWVITQVGSASVLDRTSDGIVPFGTTAYRFAGPTAANFSSLAGPIRPQELAAGNIPHALQFGWPIIASGNPIGPATHNVGFDPFGLPGKLAEGMQFYLCGADGVTPMSDLEITALNIPTWQKTICKALRTYGAYLVDHSGNPTFIGEGHSSTMGWHALAGQGDAWTKFMPNLGTGPAVGLSAAFPWANVRVLKFTYRDADQANPTATGVWTPPVGYPF